MGALGGGGQAPQGVVGAAGGQVVAHVEGRGRGGQGGRVGALLASLIGGVGPRVAGLVEGDVVGHVGLGDLLVGQQGVAGGELGVAGHQYRRHHGGLHPLVVVRVDTDLRAVSWGWVE